MVQEMVDRNIIKAEDAASHPDANKIMRALGIAKEVEVDLRSEPIAYTAGDVFVLCSDGLSDLVGASEILDLAGSRSAAQASGQLVDLANARGGHDNITALLMRRAGAAPAAARRSAGSSSRSSRWAWRAGSSTSSSARVTRACPWSFQRRARRSRVKKKRRRAASLPR